MILSPSTRRAWIEIKAVCEGNKLHQVALHPEGVDRNGRKQPYRHRRKQSPSTRRAWIEMPVQRQAPRRRPSPSTRRAWIEISVVRPMRSAL